MANTSTQHGADGRASLDAARPGRLEGGHGAGSLDAAHPRQLDGGHGAAAHLQHALGTECGADTCICEWIRAGEDADGERVALSPRRPVCLLEVRIGQSQAARLHQAIGRQLEASLLVACVSLVVMQLESESLGRHGGTSLCSSSGPCARRCSTCSARDVSNDIDDSGPQNRADAHHLYGRRWAAEWQTLYQPIGRLDFSVGWLCPLWQLASG